MGKIGLNKKEEELAAIDAAKRNHQSFAPLYNHYFSLIFRFILKRTANNTLADDITARVFLKAMLNINKYQDRGHPFSAWLYRIAINEINMYYRKSRKIQEIEVREKDVISLMTEVETEAVSEDRMHRVIQGLGSLPKNKQELIELRFFEKKSFKEIGAILGISAGNAKVRTYRAIEQLKHITLKSE